MIIQAAKTFKGTVHTYSTVHSVRFSKISNIFHNDYNIHPTNVFFNLAIISRKYSRKSIHFPDLKPRKCSLAVFFNLESFNFLVMKRGK